MNFIRRFSNSTNNIYKKQLIYRSKQRGWLEVDLILGSWATDNVMKLSDSQLKQYESILNQGTLDIYHSITGIKKVGKDIDNEIMEMIREHVKKNVITNTPSKYENNIKSKILVGSIRQTSIITEAFNSGADIVTIQNPNFKKILNQIKSDEANNLFQIDWKN